MSASASSPLPISDGPSPWFGSVVCSLLVAVSLAQAIEVGICVAQPDIAAEGHRLAKHLCSQCHLIEGSGPGSWTNAPSFESIANGSTMNQTQLTNFILTPHFAMPPISMPPRNYTRAQASAIASYILSLRR